MSLPKFTNDGALILPNGKPDGCNGSHLTVTGDPGGGIMKMHDTFQVGNKKINISGSQYNGINGNNGSFNPSPTTAQTFGDMFGKK